MMLSTNAVRLWVMAPLKADPEPAKTLSRALTLLACAVAMRLVAFVSKFGSLYFSEPSGRGSTPTCTTWVSPPQSISEIGLGAKEVQKPMLYCSAEAVCNGVTWEVELTQVSMNDKITIASPTLTISNSGNRSELPAHRFCIGAS